MKELNQLKTDFKNAKKAFEGGLDTLRADFEATVDSRGEKLDTFQINKQPVDFSLYYCLTETIDQCYRAMEEKSSRELSLVKTKLQEALFWLNEA